MRVCVRVRVCVRMFVLFENRWLAKNVRAKEEENMDVEVLHLCDVTHSCVGMTHSYM